MRSKHNKKEHLTYFGVDLKQSHFFRERVIKFMEILFQEEKKNRAVTFG